MFLLPTWMELVIVGLVGVGLVFLVRFVYAVKKLNRTDAMLRENGFDGPKPSVPSGNMKGTDFFSLTGSVYKEFSQRKVFRFFMGPNPILFVCDLDMVRQLLVKEFHHFVNHTPRAPGNVKSLQLAMHMLRDDQWKRVRASVSPTFTTGKLKRMSKRVEHTTKAVVENMVEKQERNEEIELKSVFSCLTMDLVASVGFGVEVNSTKDPTNSFRRHAEMAIFQTNLRLVSILASIVPFVLPLLNRMSGSKKKEGVDFIDRFVDVAFKNRKELGEAKGQNDFLQLMVNAENEDDKDSGDGDRKANQKDSGGGGREANQETDTIKSVSSGNMTLDEIKGQALVFILAGYDTVSNALSFVLFLLAIHPECREKVQEEIDQKIGRQGIINYENVHKLEYLEMCISETLRMFPPGPFLERMTNSDTEIQGIKFTRGMSVLVPICYIHRDPLYWPDPDNFIPERFTEENKAARHPFAYLPFGQGQRNCIGMRLAQLEMSITLASILQRLTPVRSEKTVYPVKITTVNMRTQDGMWIRLDKR